MRIIRILGVLLALSFVLVLLAGAGVAYGLWHYGRTLPDYQQLADYSPAVMTRVHAADGSLIAEYARERRLFVPIEAIPKRVIEAFLAAEDKNFYSHSGVDPLSVLRAVYVNVRNIGRNRRPVGASTITQQVAKNFLLTNEVSVERKIKEAILAFRIERAFTKDRILELYLNEIYLGMGAYGVAAATLNYFDKPMDELTTSEVAFLAALPKAPNNYHPVRYPERARDRRNWVIGRMVEDRRIDAVAAAAARAEPLIMRRGEATEAMHAEWFTEEARRELLARYGEERLYEGGLSVRTSMNPRYQIIGEQVLRAGLVTYDRRHGYRGPIATLQETTGPGIGKGLAMIARPRGLLDHWRLAAVVKAGPARADIVLADGSDGFIAVDTLKWARRVNDQGNRGPRIKETTNVFAVGDVVAVARTEDLAAGQWTLMQVPRINGALVAMDPHTGRVLAMVGGWRFGASQFNRATQAQRQPGSAFKPFVYAAALDSGFTPASLVLDAPFVIDQGPGLGKWKPSNYTKKFYGPSTLRLGIEKSRNLMTVRLAQSIGMDRVVDYARRFGVVDDMPAQLSMALGARETTLLRLTTAYAMLVNGGKRIRPTVIDRVQNRRGKTVFRHDERPCPDCRADGWLDQGEPQIPDTRQQVIDAITAYQVVAMLRGVVQRGTGVRINAVGKPLAGKTGTTNESRDTWFVGFSPDLAVGVFAGFDVPESLGKRETGSSVPAPIFRDFMAAALKAKKAIPFRIPKGVRLVRIQVATGRLAKPGMRRVIWEAFRPGTEPTGDNPVLRNPGQYSTGVADQTGQSSGLY